MAENDQPVAEGLFGLRDTRNQLVWRRERVVVRQRSLKTQHVLPPMAG